jgi:hypothetical protein
VGWTWVNTIMPTIVLFVASLAMTSAEGRVPLLSGAFIPLDGQYAPQTNRELLGVLDRMRGVKLDTVILQYLEKGTAGETTSSFLPAFAGDYDPVRVTLDYADAHPGMTVLLGLRYDASLFHSILLNAPAELHAELTVELLANQALAARLAKQYRLKHRKSFGGWYLPTEVANYPETYACQQIGWVSQGHRTKIPRDSSRFR